MIQPFSVTRVSNQSLTTAVVTLFVIFMLYYLELFPKNIIFVIVMVTEKYLHIYQVDHRGLTDGTLVMADSIQDAIEKFSEYYAEDYDINPDGITGVKEVYNLEVLQ